MDVVRVVRDRLKAYLDVELASEGVSVMAEWPAGATLPERAVSLVVADEASPEVRYWPPCEFNVIVPADPENPTGRTQYSYGAFKVPLQMDVWTRYPDVRTSLVDRLDRALHRHPNATLANDTWPRLGRWPELALRVSDLPGCVLFYRLGAVPVPSEGSLQAQEGEYRATFTGHVDGLLTTEESVAILRRFSVSLDGETYTLEGS